MDSKGSLVEPLGACLHAGGREADLLKIGPRHATFWNPLHQPFLTANNLADSFIQVLENLNGAKYKSDSMWIRHGSRMLLESCIGLIRLMNKGYVTAALVLELISEILQKIQGEDKPALLAGDIVTVLFLEIDLDADATEAMNFYRAMLIKVFSQDEKFRAIFASEVENVLSPLCDLSVFKKYNSTIEQLDMPDWATIINTGKIIVLDCNQTEYPGLSIVLGMLLKLGYQNAVLSRLEWAKSGRVDMERYMILAIDEYQQFASQSDADYVALCRQSLSISIFLTQGHVSLVDRVGKETTEKLEHSLRNKLILSQPNAADAAALFGKAERERTARSINENIEEASLGATGKFSGKSTVAQSLNISSSEENAVSEEILRNLPLGQGILMSHTGLRIIPPHRVFLRAGFLPGVRYVDTPAANSVVH
jgi:hypothetical protein